ncbi:hypothetical protein DIPPA_06585 [Diplonema papillatum]|nr:hypothetical protein DIPPA_06585 [Diplonema papillatum]
MNCARQKAAGSAFWWLVKAPNLKTKQGEYTWNRNQPARTNKGHNPPTSSFLGIDEAATKEPSPPVSTKTRQWGPGERMRRPSAIGGGSCDDAEAESEEEPAGAARVGCERAGAAAPASAPRCAGAPPRRVEHPHAAAAAAAAPPSPQGSASSASRGTTPLPYPRTASTTLVVPPHSSSPTLATRLEGVQLTPGWQHDGIAGEILKSFRTVASSRLARLLLPRALVRNKRQRSADLWAEFKVKGQDPPKPSELSIPTGSAAHHLLSGLPPGQLAVLLQDMEWAAYEPNECVVLRGCPLQRTVMIATQGDLVLKNKAQKCAVIRPATVVADFVVASHPPKRGAKFTAGTGQLSAYCGPTDPCVVFFMSQRAVDVVATHQRRNPSLPRVTPGAALGHPAKDAAPLHGAAAARRSHFAGDGFPFRSHSPSVYSCAGGSPVHSPPPDTQLDRLAAGAEALRKHQVLAAFAHHLAPKKQSHAFEGALAVPSGPLHPPPRHDDADGLFSTRLASCCPSPRESVATAFERAPSGRPPYGRVWYRGGPAPVPPVDADLAPGQDSAAGRWKRVPRKGGAPGLTDLEKRLEGVVRPPAWKSNGAVGEAPFVTAVRPALPLLVLRAARACCKRSRAGAAALAVVPHTAASRLKLRTVRRLPRGYHFCTPKDDLPPFSLPCRRLIATCPVVDFSEEDPF